MATRLTTATTANTGVPISTPVARTGPQPAPKRRRSSVSTTTASGRQSPKVKTTMASQ